MADLLARAKQLITNEPDLCIEIAKIINAASLAGMGLTERQRELLEFIRARNDKYGVAPSFQEMADHMGLASRGRIHRLVVALEERGAIRRLPNRVRAIEIVGAAI